MKKFLFFSLSILFLFTSCSSGKTNNDKRVDSSATTAESANAVVDYADHSQKETLDDSAFFANKRRREYSIVDFEKYGHAVTSLSVADALKVFSLGDSVNITFSNGYKLKDIPFYSGYYTKKGEALLRAYPGDKFVAVCINYGNLKEKADLNLKDTFVISMNSKGKYLETESLNSLKYTNERKDYSSDEVFANFREVSSPSIKKGVLYRSASPINNKYSRASYASKLAQKHAIKSVLNLADTKDELTSYIKKADFNSPYYRRLYEDGRVVLASLPLEYNSQAFKVKLGSSLKKLLALDNISPILIHCTEGKDRAGFVIALLQSLSGCSYKEIVDEYMLSYKNYYNVRKEDDEKRYSLIVKNNIDEMLKYIADVDKVSEITSKKLTEGAREYLEDCKLTKVEINKLLSIIKK